MTIKSTLATAALAATVVLGFAAAANAATIQYDTKLYANPGSGQIGWVHEGQWVDVQGCYKNYCWVQKPGPDGFVRASAIDFDHGYDYGWWYSHLRQRAGLRLLRQSVMQGGNQLPQSAFILAPPPDRGRRLLLGIPK